MIHSKTAEFVSVRNLDAQIASNSLNTIYLRNNLLTIKEKVVEYKKLLDINNLPSFRENKNRKSQIDLLKNEIISLSKTSKNDILEFSNQVKVKMIKEMILEHFNSLLEQELRFFRLAITENIRKTSSFEILNNIVNNSNENLLSVINNQQQYLNKNSNASINASLLSISNVLMEMKMSIKTQTASIDTLDRYFETSNKYLQAANEEISKIPKNFIGVKDKIISILLVFIFILLILLTYKEINKRRV
ncbi:hypothetical protein NUSPORA_00350 [Nucleospora cyclopteri]